MPIDPKNIAVAIYDQRRPPYEDIADRLVDLTQFRLLPYTKNSQVSLITDIDQYLQSLPDNIEWAVIFAAGTFIFGDDMIQHAVEHARENSSSLSGHIIERHGFWHLHPQFFALDLKIYRQLGIRLAPESNVTQLISCGVRRSEKNVHHDYTPLWLEVGCPGVKVYDVEQDEFAQRYIAALLLHGHRVVNLSSIMRHSKKYSYPESSHPELRKLMADLRYRTSQVGGYGDFFEIMNQSGDSLDRGFYVINTEDFDHINDDSLSPITVFAGVCGGLKPMLVTSQPEFDSQCHLILFDISEMAIEWQKTLRAKWDGGLESFITVANEFIESNPGCLPITSRYHNPGVLAKNLSTMLNRPVDDQLCRQLWQAYLGKTVEYHKLDLLKEENQDFIIDRINQSKGHSYFWVSNLFRMDWQFFCYGKAWSHQHSMRWVKKCQTDLDSSHFLEINGQLYRTVDKGTPVQINRR